MEGSPWLTLRRPPMTGWVPGAALVVLGVGVPAPALLHLFRPEVGAQHDDLLLGVLLFKAGLAVIGLLIVALGCLDIWTRPGPRGLATSGPGPGTAWPLLVVILVTALGLRLYALDAGLWLDEILTYVDYVSRPLGEIVTTFDSKNQHFLYSILAWLASQVLGDGAVALRLPAVLFGVGSIWALYLFGRHVATTREALLAAALLTFSYHHVWFSQNARGYSGLLFWTLLSSYLLLRALDEERPQLWVLYAIAVALGVYTQMGLLFVIAAHGAIYVGTVATRAQPAGTIRWLGLVLGFGLGAVLTLELHALVLPVLGKNALGEISLVPAWISPLWALQELSRGLQVGFGGAVAAVGALLVFGSGLWSYWRTNRVLVHLLVLPCVVCAAVVVGLGHHVWPRLFIFAMGFAALVVMRGVMVWGAAGARLLRWPARRAARLQTALGAGLVAVSGLSLPLAYGPKQDYLGALAFVEGRREPGDVVLTAGLAAMPYKSFYKVDWQEVRGLEALEHAMAGARRAWFVYTLPAYLEAVDPDVMATVSREFRLVGQFRGTLNGGTVFVRSWEAGPMGLSRAEPLSGPVRTATDRR